MANGLYGRRIARTPRGGKRTCSSRAGSDRAVTRSRGRAVAGAARPDRLQSHRTSYLETPAPPPAKAPPVARDLDAMRADRRGGERGEAEGDRVHEPHRAAGARTAAAGRMGDAPQLATAAQRAERVAGRAASSSPPTTSASAPSRTPAASPKNSATTPARGTTSPIG